MKTEQGFWRTALQATTLGWELALPIFGGVLLGYYLDRHWETGHIFTLGLLVVGIAAGFYNVLRRVWHVETQDRLEGGEESETDEET